MNYVGIVSGVARAGPVCAHAQRQLYDPHKVGGRAVTSIGLCATGCRESAEARNVSFFACSLEMSCAFCLFHSFELQEHQPINLSARAIMSWVDSAGVHLMMSFACHVAVEFLSVGFSPCMLFKEFLASP